MISTISGWPYIIFSPHSTLVSIKKKKKKKIEFNHSIRYFIFYVPYWFSCRSCPDRKYSRSKRRLNTCDRCPLMSPSMAEFLSRSPLRQGVRPRRTVREHRPFQVISFPCTRDPRKVFLGLRISRLLSITIHSSASTLRKMKFSRTHYIFIHF